MFSVHKNRILIVACALGLLAAALLIPVAIAYAQSVPGTAANPASAQADPSSPPSLDDLQAQADAITGEIASLDQYLEIAVEQHNATRTQLDQLTMELNQSRQQLDEATQERDAQQLVISKRLEAIYKAGEINFMTVLMNSTSFNDFFTQTQYLHDISDHDQRLESQFEDTVNRIQTITDDIDHKRAEQMRLEAAAAQEQNDIQAKIDERRLKLDSVNVQVAQILEAERQQELADQARLAADQSALLASLNISDATQRQVVETALHYLGVPYVWGGESPAGMDCSGLTKFVFAQHGVQLPHNAAMQYGLGVPVPDDQLQPGDLVFFGPVSPYHVGMYIGQGKFIEAPTFGEVVKVSTLYMGSEYAGARRYPLRPRVGPPW